MGDKVDKQNILDYKKESEVKGTDTIEDFKEIKEEQMNKEVDDDILENQKPIVLMEKDLNDDEMGEKQEDKKVVQDILENQKEIEVMEMVITDNHIKEKKKEAVQDIVENQEEIEVIGKDIIDDLNKL